LLTNLARPGVSDLTQASAAADGGYSGFCCKRLVDDWRVITTFEPGVAIVVAVGRHDSRAFYVELSKTLAIGAAGQGRKEKPACCGEDGWPSVGLVPAVT
jgi:hypothetical protein